VRRSVVVFAIWVFGVLGATTVAWNAVRLVSSEVTDRTGRSLTSADIARELAASATGATASSGPRATSSPSRRPAGQPSASGRSSAPRPAQPGTRPGDTAPGSSTRTSAPARAPVSRTWSLQGGTAAVSCSGSTATLQYASPRSGYDSEVSRSGRVIDIRFESADHESRLKVECVGGAPQGEVREED
jgi:hypothetical protein